MISISELPIFCKYLYSYLKDDSEYNLSQKFIEQNFIVVDYCKCKQDNCATIYMKSNISIIKYIDRSRSMCSQTEVNIVEYFHVKDGGYVLEFEWIHPFDDCCAIYKNEVYTAINSLNLEVS